MDKHQNIINHRGGVVGIIQLIRSNDNTYSSLNKYLDVLEKNYNDEYYSISNKIHNKFYDNIYLNDVKSLLFVLEYLFYKVCSPIVSDINNKLFYKRDNEDKARLKRINTVFLILLTNTDLYRDKMNELKNQINIDKNQYDQIIENSSEDKKTIFAELDKTSELNKSISDFKNFILSGDITYLENGKDNMIGGSSCLHAGLNLLPTPFFLVGAVIIGLCIIPYILVGFKNLFKKDDKEGGSKVKKYISKKSIKRRKSRRSINLRKRSMKKRSR
jgi:hypothetical protein